MDATPLPTVLVVDDDPQVRSVFSGYLGDRYEVRGAGSGDEAIEELDEGIDVVLLDRRMVGMSGGEVLEWMRENEFDQPVALVTAVEPDFDILEMGFDDYLLKPTDRAELRELVDTMLLRKEYDEVIREYFSLVSKVTVLEREKRASELDSNGDYQSSTVKLEEIQTQARRALEVAMEEGKFEALFREVPPDPPDPERVTAAAGADG